MFDGNSGDLMMTGNYSATASTEPITSSSPPAAVNDDNDDKNDVKVTSPADSHTELDTTKRKTRKKRSSRSKSEEIDEEAATEQVDKGFHFSPF